MTDSSTPPSAFGTQHEQVVFCHDEASGLKAIIAIYSTALGPALGGTRFYPYGSEQEALADVLNLSQGMAYKAALAGLDLGGGKAVIIGDPNKLKSEALLRAYGRFVQSINGRYYTACDVGTFSPDMDIIARECDFVTGRTVEHGGAGDSSVLTAFGVYQGMRASAFHVWGDTSLAGKTVGVAGVGKVGHHLVGLLLEDGANVVVTDVYAPAVEALRETHPSISVVADTAALVREPLDIYAPCALGGALDDEVVSAAFSPGSAPPARATSTAMNRSVKASGHPMQTTRSSPCCRPRSSAVPPTTNSRTMASTNCLRTAGSHTRPTTASMPVAWCRLPTSSRVSTSTVPKCGQPRSTTRHSACSNTRRVKV